MLFFAGVEDVEDVETGFRGVRFGDMGWEEGRWGLTRECGRESSRGG